MSRDPLKHIISTHDESLAMFWESPEGARVANAREANEINWETALPTRKAAMYRGRRNTDGLYWCAATNEHVYFESLLEKQSLMLLEHTHDLSMVRSQPFRVELPGVGSHYPDFLIDLVDGSRVLLDVRTAERIDVQAEELFAATSAWAESLGWRHMIHTGLTGAPEANLRWLAGFRHPRLRPPAAMAERLRRLVAGTPRSIRDLRDDALVGNVPTLAYVYNMLWHRHLALMSPQRVLTLAALVGPATPEGDSNAS